MSFVERSVIGKREVVGVAELQSDWLICGWFGAKPQNLGITAVFRFSHIALAGLTFVDNYFGLTTTPRQNTHACLLKG